MIEQSQMATGNPVYVPTGHRKLTRGLLEAEARASTVSSAQLLPRYRVKAVIPILRRRGDITAGEGEFLSALIDFCGTWEADNIAVVFASNDRIRSRLPNVNNNRTVRAKIASLGRKGLICHIERPGGRRGVEIDPFTGEKLVFGISLLPLIALVPDLEREFDEIEDTYRRKATLIKKGRYLLFKLKDLMENTPLHDRNSAHRQPTSLTLIDANEYPLSQEASEEEITAAVDCIEGLYHQARTAIIPVRYPSNSSPEDSVEQANDTVGSKESSLEAPTLPPETITKNITDKSERYPRKKGRMDRSRKQDQPTHPQQRDRSNDVNAEIDTYKVTPNLLTAISETLYAFLPYDRINDPDWPAVLTAADSAATTIGLSTEAWRAIVSSLSPRGACAALAVATAEVNRSSISKSSAAYLVWMAKHSKIHSNLGLGPKVRSAYQRSTKLEFC